VSVNGDGGGLFMQSSNATISDNTITNNGAGRDAGGLYVASSNATVTNNMITDNSADTRHGGGVVVSSSGGQFLGNTVTGNFAANVGGGFWVAGGGTNTTLSDNTITGNEALQRGGGLYWSGSGGSLAGVKGDVCNTIMNNLAPIAEAIYYTVPFAGDGSGDLDASHVCWGTVVPAEILALNYDYFDNGNFGVIRTTPFEGGPLLVDTTWTLAGSPYVVMESIVLGSDATLTIEPGVVVRFEAMKSISVGTSPFGTSCIIARGTPADPILFTSILPAGERAPGDWVNLYFGDQSEDAVFDGGGAYLGGCILEHVIVEFGGGGVATTGSITIQQSSPYLKNIEVRDSARAGVYADAAVTVPLRIEDSTFRRCVHTGNGGGVYLVNGSGHQVTGNLFDDNGASSGAGMYLSATTSLVDDNMFTSNAANSQGGGLWISSASGTVTDNTFTDNSGSAGGGLFVSNLTSGMIMTNLLEDNSASNGAGMYLQSGTGTQVLDNQFLTNVASGSYGGVYLGGSTITFSTNVVSGNQAVSVNGDGGGLFMQSSNATISDNTITNNGAGRDAGGLYVASS
ncbi:MAG: right-handed parallel beta-helix repeat-containing protein, partial [Phycisphaerales bacterium]|nr:right-handed parallel beta-helix repeat-containing protein [Phycisphaerales bacterium]